MTTPADTAPVRIQRKRTKGWRMPPNTVYVGRPTPWGNPFVLTGAVCNECEDGICDGFFHRPAIAEVVEAFRERRESIRQHHERSGTGFIEKWLAPLRGKNLACWCPLDQPCHADVLLEIANR